MRGVGVVGMPGAGSSTVFAGLTGAAESASARSAQAVVPVPDTRVDVLADLHRSRKRAYAKIRFVEASALVRRGARGAGSLPAELIGYLRECDALLLVVRAFADGDPQNERDQLMLELALADLEVIGGKLERTAKEARVGVEEAKRLEVVLDRAREALERGTPLRDLGLDVAQVGLLADLAPLTLKPVVVVANVGEGERAGPPEGMLAVPAALEAEVAGLPPEEAAELLASYGHGERALDQVIRAVYRALGLVTFLTCGEKESRAWQVRAGAAAPEAAGQIHSDIERGFIRAEVCPYEEVVAAGGWRQAKNAGRVRQEGKAYRMREGDVVEFRFAV